MALTPSAVSAKIRVLCVDDSPDITELIGRCIEREPDMESVGCLDTAEDLATEVERVRAAVVLVDMKMPGRDPLDAVREVRRARVIVYSGRDDPDAVDSAAKAGACGFLSKDAEVPVMLGAIREVARGGIPFGIWL